MNINDLVSGGYDPLQHHDPSAGVHERYARFAVRISGRDDVGRYQHVVGSTGDILGGYLWRYLGQPEPLAPPVPDTKPVRDLPLWAFAFPAVVASPQDILQASNGLDATPEQTLNESDPRKGATGGGAAGDQPPWIDPAAWVLPVSRHPKHPDPGLDWNRIDLGHEPDTRFQSLRVQPGWHVHAGTPGVLLGSTDENRHEAVFIPSPQPLLSVHRPIPGTTSLLDADKARKFSTLVYDVKATSQNGPPVPDERVFASLDSAWRVVRPKGRDVGSLALDIQTRGDGWGRVGLVSGFPFPNASPFPTNPAAGDPFAALARAAGAAAPAGAPAGGNAWKFGTPNDKSPRYWPGVWTRVQAINYANWLTGQGYTGVIIYTNGLGDGATIPIFILGYDNAPAGGATSSSPPPPKPDDIAPDEQKAAYSIGALSRGEWGPLDTGGPGCCHPLGKTHDGETIYSTHLHTETYWRDDVYDAPLTFEGRLPQKPKSAPLLVPAHIYWDPDATHMHTSGKKPGRWKLYAESFDYVTGGGTSDSGAAPTPTGALGTPSPPGRPSTPGTPTQPGHQVVVCQPSTVEVKQWRATPNVLVTPGIILRPQSFQEGVPDHRSVRTMTAAHLRLGDLAPAVLRIEAFGNEAGGAWSRRLERGSSEFPGGIADGGLYIAHPERDPKNEINETPYPITPPSTPGTYVLFDPDINVGTGRPGPGGTVTGFTPFGGTSPTLLWSGIVTAHSGAGAENQSGTITNVGDLPVIVNAWVRANVAGLAIYNAKAEVDSANDIVYWIEKVGTGFEDFAVYTLNDTGSDYGVWFSVYGWPR